MNEHLWENEWLHWGKRMLENLLVLYLFYKNLNFFILINLTININKQKWMDVSGKNEWSDCNNIFILRFLHWLNLKFS